MLTVVRNIKNLHFYYKTCEDQRIKMIDMKKFDLDDKKILRLHTKDKRAFIDVGDKLK